MRANAILVRWKGGWRWVTDVGSDLRIEICQGHAGDGDEVIAKAEAELDTYKAGQTQVTVGVAPGTWVTTLVPGDAVNVDDSWQEIEAHSATLDDSTGQWTDVPQFGAVLDDPEARIDRTLRNIGGLNQGTSHVARPVQAFQPPPGVRPPS